MKLTCDKNTLQEGIFTAQKAVTGKSTMPILLGMLFTASNGELKITATDLDLSIETIVKAQVSEEGTVVIDARLIGEIIRKLPNATVEINTLDNNNVEIICQKSRFTLLHLNSEDFPKKIGRAHV